MSIAGVVKCLTYRKSLVRLARLFHLQRPLEKIYTRLMQPRSGRAQTSVRNLRAEFHVGRPGELRIVEVIGVRKGGEHRLIERLMDELSLGETFYDIGASIGTHTIFLAKHVGPSGRVVSFEPEPASRDRLLQNIGLNDLRNVTVVPVALGDNESFGTLRDVEGLGTFSLASDGGTRVCDGVPIIPGDLLRRRQGLPGPHVVKIDVEGFEYSVLSGLKETLSEASCRCVCYEHHTKLLPPDLGFLEFEALFRSMGFTRVETNYRLGGFHMIWSKN